MKVDYVSSRREVTIMCLPHFWHLANEVNLVTHGTGTSTYLTNVHVNLRAMALFSTHPLY